jgi:hypothetical protein
MLSHSVGGFSWWSCCNQTHPRVVALTCGCWTVIRLWLADGLSNGQVTLSSHFSIPWRAFGRLVRHGYQPANIWMGVGGVGRVVTGLRLSTLHLWVCCTVGTGTLEWFQECTGVAWKTLWISSPFHFSSVCLLSLTKRLAVGKQPDGQAAPEIRHYLPSVPARLYEAVLAIPCPRVWGRLEGNMLKSFQR